jgi:hypothetical protein
MGGVPAQISGKSCRGSGVAGRAVSDRYHAVAGMAETGLSAHTLRLVSRSGLLTFPWRTTMFRAVATLVLLTLAIPLAGCVVEGPGHPGYCYYHPYKCGR